MTLVNLTFAVSAASDCAFRSWVNDIFIKALSEGGFLSPLFCRVLGEDSQAGEASYAVQFLSTGVREGKRWLECGPGSECLSSLRGCFGDSVLWFTTYLEVISGR